MRRIKGLITLLAGLALLLLLAVSLAGDRLAHRTIVRGASAATGLDAELHTARLTLRRGELSIDRLRLASPDGFNAPHTLTLQTGQINLRLASLMRQSVSIDHLRLAGIDLHIEHRRGRLNIQPLLDRIDELWDDDPDAPGKRYRVAELVIADVTVHLNLGSLLGRTYALRLPIDEIRLTNVGEDTEAGLLASQLGVRVLHALLEHCRERAGVPLPPLVSP